MMDVVYFSVDNWFSERDYPAEEPFLSWMKDDLNLTLRDEQFVKENKLVVVAGFLDMSMCFNVTAPKGWVEKVCPCILGTDFEIKDMKPEFLEAPGIGKWGGPFLAYTEDNIGIHWYNFDDEEWDDE